MFSLFSPPLSAFLASRVCISIKNTCLFVNKLWIKNLLLTFVFNQTCIKIKSNGIIIAFVHGMAKLIGRDFFHEIIRFNKILLITLLYRFMHEPARLFIYLFEVTHWQRVVANAIRLLVSYTRKSLTDGIYFRPWKFSTFFSFAQLEHQWMLQGFGLRLEFKWCWLWIFRFVKTSLQFLFAQIMLSKRHSAAFVMIINWFFLFTLCKYRFFSYPKAGSIFFVGKFISFALMKIMIFTFSPKPGKNIFIEILAVWREARWSMSKEE